MSEEAMSILVAARWEKGNIRELRNCIRAMTAYQVDRVLVPAGIPDWLWADKDSVADEGVATEELNTSLQIKLTLDQGQGYEQASDLLLMEMIKQFAKQPGTHSIRRMAARLRLPKSTLANKMRKAVDRGVVSDEELKKFWPK